MAADSTVTRYMEQLNLSAVEDIALEEALARQEQDLDAEPIPQSMHIVIYAPKPANNWLGTPGARGRMVMLCKVLQGAPGAQVTRYRLPRVSTTALPHNVRERDAAERTVVGYCPHPFTPESVAGMPWPKPHCMDGLVKRKPLDPTDTAILIKRKELYAAVKLRFAPTIKPELANFGDGRTYAFGWFDVARVTARRPRMFKAERNLVAYFCYDDAVLRQANETLELAKAKLRAEMARKAYEEEFDDDDDDDDGRSDSVAQTEDEGDEEREEE